MKAWIWLVLLLMSSMVACGGEDEADTDGDTATDGDASQDDDDSDDDDDATDGDEESSTDGDVEDEPLVCEDSALPSLAMTRDETFYIGPYLMYPTPDSIVIMWKTAEEANGTVLFGEVDETEQSIGHEDAKLIHEVKLTGLKPDTRYAYRVRSADVTSELHHFRTAVKPGSTFRFALWGDNQNGPATFSTVVEGIGEQTPHILVGVGDHVQAGSDLTLWHDQLFDPARALFHETAFFAAIGNHEQNDQNLYDHYSYPHPEDNPGHESYYSFTYGNAFFLVVDTNKPFFPILDTSTEISEWIVEQVESEAARNATWRFALAHEPGYSEAWGDGSCTYDGYSPVRNWLLPLLDEHQFHAYFSGHMHGYERGMVNGVATIIAGGGGGSLDAWCLDWETTKVAHYEHHFLRVDCGCDTLTVKALYPNGEEFDWLVLSADTYGVPLEEGPVADLPEPTINSDSPSLQE